MALINIEYGSLASSTTLNNNFNSLDTSISTLSSVVASNKSSLESSISTLSNQTTTSINSVKEEIETLDSDFIELATSGTIALTNNSINKISVNGAVTFTLPSVSSSTKLAQILVQVDMPTVYSIGVGTTYYFNKKAPDMSEAGMYNLIYEYDKENGYWVCGYMKKGTV